MSRLNTKDLDRRFKEILDIMTDEEIEEWLRFDEEELKK